MDHRQYASTAEYAEYTGSTTSDAILRRASATIDSLTRLTVRDVDDDGYPTDPDIEDAYTRATCAQAQWIVDNGAPTSAAPKYQSMSLGSLSLSSGTKSTGTTAATAASRYSPEAVEILNTAGLLTSVVSHV